MHICKKSSNFVAKFGIFMKKTAFILISLMVMVGFASCEYHTTECRFHSKTLDLPVSSNEWQFDNATQRFYAHFTVKDLTSEIYNYGSWTISREYNSGTTNAYLVALPESIYKTEELNDGSIAYYTQHIDYAVGPGWVEITLTNSDYFYPADAQGYLYAPEAMHFLMQIVY